MIQGKWFEAHCILKWSRRKPVWYIYNPKWNKWAAVPNWTKIETEAAHLRLNLLWDFKLKETFHYQNLKIWKNLHEGNVEYFASNTFLIQLVQTM